VVGPAEVDKAPGIVVGTAAVDKVVAGMEPVVVEVAHTETGCNSLAAEVEEEKAKSVVDMGKLVASGPVHLADKDSELVAHTVSFGKKTVLYGPAGRATANHRTVLGFVGMAAVKLPMKREVAYYMKDSVWDPPMLWCYFANL
jgi:hypothetical protein